MSRTYVSGARVQRHTRIRHNRLCSGSQRRRKARTDNGLEIEESPSFFAAAGNSAGDSWVPSMLRFQVKNIGFKKEKCDVD